MHHCLLFWLCVCVCLRNACLFYTTITTTQTLKELLSGEISQAVTAQTCVSYPVRNQIAHVCHSCQPNTHESLVCGKCHDSRQLSWDSSANQTNWSCHLEPMRLPDLIRHDCSLSVYKVTLGFLSLLSSLGVALSRGHGKYAFSGNISVEEGNCGWPSLFISRNSSWMALIAYVKKIRYHGWN